MKYCDTCVHFIKKGMRCALFGARQRQGERVAYLPVEYVRATPFKMCGIEGTFHMTLGEKRQMEFHKKMQKRIDYDTYFGFTPEDYQVHDPQEEFDRDMEVEKRWGKGRKRGPGKEEK